jgi:hypothetical protein
MRHDAERTETLQLAYAMLACAGPTATGATLILPSGERLYIDADDARAMAGNVPARGRA